MRALRHMHRMRVQKYTTYGDAETHAHPELEITEYGQKRLVDRCSHQLQTSKRLLAVPEESGPTPKSQIRLKW